MAPINLTDSKMKLLSCSAVLAVGQAIASTLSSPVGQGAVGFLGGSVGVLGASVLSTIVANLAGGITANELGARLLDRLSQSTNILENHDLTKAAGEAIALLIRAAAKSDELIDIAERNNLRYPEAELTQIADKAADYWLKINTSAAALSTRLQISEAQLAKIFSPDAGEFAKVTALECEDWEKFLSDWLASENKSFDTAIVKAIASELQVKFPRAFREVLKQDAAAGGQKFAAMLFNLHAETLSVLKELGLQSGEIRQKLEALATKEQICQLVAHLESIELGIRDDLAQMRELLQNFVDASAPRLPLPYQYQTIIEEKTREFVGRRYVFDEIKRFLQNNPKGYFILEGEPGVGKSAILAMCVRAMKSRCVAHFNVQSQGMVKPEQFLENACTQLIQGFKLDYKSLPENATKDGNFLARLLGEVSAKLGGKKLVLVVDALDEVDMGSAKRDNVLFLPEFLPPGIYCIVSKRPQSVILRMDSAPRLFDLMQYPAQSQEDVKTYIRQRVRNSAGIQEWIAGQGLSVEQFVTALAQKSQNNFMYLRYVLDDINSGGYSDATINSLPQGLENYYESHWQRMGMTAEPLPRVKIKIVYVLCEAREAVSRRWIAKSAGEDEFTVQAVLNEWQAFLRPQPVDGETRYSIYHASFRDFLHRQDVVQAAGVTLQDVNRLISDNLTKGAPK